MKRRIIIGALSARQYPERRKRCRETWFGEAAGHANVEALFLIGAEGEVAAPVLVDDLLLLPCPNDYPSLPQRTRWFCRWAVEHRSFDYLFKCDDDTFVCIDRLANYETADRHYIGAEWQPGVGYASGGGGYFLSRRAAQIVAERLVAREGAEDKLVGDVLREAGIPLSIDERFTPYGSSLRRPTSGNDLITTHAVSRDLLVQSHRETSRAWPVRIAMPCEQGEAARAAIRGLKEHWVDHPDVDLLSQGGAGQPMARVSAFDVGGQTASSPTAALREYLIRCHRDQFLLFMPDDCRLGSSFRSEAVRAAIDHMARRPQIAVVYLRSQPAGPKRPWEGLLVLPRAANTICWQPAIWRRDFLLQLLEVAGDATVGDFERRAGEWFLDYGGLDTLCCQLKVPEPSGEDSSTGGVGNSARRNHAKPVGR